MQPSSPNATWLPRADGLRFIAVLAVFGFELGRLAGAPALIGAGPILAGLDVGFTVLFALTGATLARPFVVALFDGGPAPSTRALYRRVVRRALPAYWVALTATYLVLRPFEARHASVADALLHYALLQIYPSGVAGRGLATGWAVATAASFVLALPLLAAGARRAVRDLDGTSRQAVVLLALLVACVVESHVWIGLVYALDWPQQLARWLPAVLDAFAVGIGCVVLVEWARRREMPRSLVDTISRHDILWWIAGLAVFVFTTNQAQIPPGTGHVSWDFEVARHGLLTLTALLVVLPVVVGTTDRGVIRRALASPPARLLGAVAYGVFLWQGPLLDWAIRRGGHRVFHLWPARHGLVSGVVLRPAALALALALVAAIVSRVVLEARGRHLLRTPRAPEGADR